MTELERDYQKAVKVIASCDDRIQMKICAKYIEMFNKKHLSIREGMELKNRFREKFLSISLYNS